MNILRKIDSKVRNLAAYFDFSFSFAESCGKKNERGVEVAKRIFRPCLKAAPKENFGFAAAAAASSSSSPHMSVLFPCVFSSTTHCSKAKKKKRKKV